MTIERAAKAIARHMLPERDWPADFEDHLLACYRDCSIAALDAIAEPTPEMIKAGLKALPGSVDDVWRAMHAEMMKEGTCGE